MLCEGRGDMNFIKNKAFWMMLFIVTLGTILRLVFIDKAEGLWNDEYISWQIASVPLGKDFFSAVASQCHMPFYYLYLKFFMHFFGQSDLLLRLTSVLAGVLSIFAMYFVGKEFKNKNLGILCASMSALSSFLIYFSQEVRFYQLLFLFSALLLLFTLKLGKQRNLSNMIFFGLSNLLVLLTHTIGFVFVFFNLVFLSCWLIKSDETQKKTVKAFWGTLVVMLLALSPLVLKIFGTQSYSQWWGHFTISKIGFLFTDYFSPVLTNLVNAPDNFFYDFSFKFFIFALLPTAIAIAGIVKALKTRRYEILGLFFVSLATVLVLALTAITGKLVFITKYSIEIYPILIVMAGFGLLEIENKILRRFLIFAFCFLNVFYLWTNPNSAPKMLRMEGHKIVADLLKHAHIKKGDTILLTYYGKDRFERYFDFNNYKVVSINKSNFPKYLGEADSKEVLKNGKKLYRETFADTNDEFFDKVFESKIIKGLKPNQRVTVIVLNTVSMYSPIQMQKIAQADNFYTKVPFLFLVFSYIKNNSLKTCLKTLKIERVEQKGDWSAITFYKT